MYLRICTLLSLLMTFASLSLAQNKLRFGFTYAELNVKTIDKIRHDFNALPFNVFGLDNFYLNPELRADLGYSISEHVEAVVALGFTSLRNRTDTFDLEKPLIIKMNYLNSEIGFRFHHTFNFIEPFIQTGVFLNSRFSSVYENFSNARIAQETHEDTIQNSYWGLSTEFGVRTNMNSPLNLVFGLRNRSTFSELQRFQNSTKSINTTGLFVGVTYKPKTE